MGYPKEIYDSAWRELEQRALQAKNRERARREEIRRSIPEIGRIERELASTAAEVTRAVIGAPQNAKPRIAELRERNLDLQETRRALLLQHGYPADYLEEQFECPQCRDKGYTGSRMCGCLQALLRRVASTCLSEVSGAEQYSFQSFSLDYYPSLPADKCGVAPRQRMGQILDFCRQYASGFSRESESLLLLGKTGLGKTHLSLAVAGSVTEAGFGVVYTPVQKLMDRLESEKFSRASPERGNYVNRMEQVLSCDLLVMDDLGTEFFTQFTGSVLYNIINTRLMERRPTIISTNLELPQIEEKYSQRMISRLVCSYKVLKFYGKDIRFLKKAEGRP